MSYSKILINEGGGCPWNKPCSLYDTCIDVPGHLARRGTSKISVKLLEVD
jgi:hypothetical protein